MRRVWWVGVVVLIATVAGCLPRVSDIRPAGLWDRMRGNTDGFVVRSVLIDQPVGDAYLNKQLWATAGRPLPHELSTLLAQNGLRVGVFSGIIPTEFDRLVNSEQATINPIDRSMVSGKSKIIPVNGPIDRSTFRVLRDLTADPVPVEFFAVECGLSVTAYPVEGNRVRMVLAWQVQHGDKQLYLNPTADNSTFTRSDRKPLETYSTLTCDVTIGTSDYLILGATEDPVEKLGQAFFIHSTPDRVRQRLLVIRGLRNNDLADAGKANINPNATTAGAAAQHPVKP